MSTATTFEARVGSRFQGAGNFLVTERLSDYALQSLVDSVAGSAASVTVRLFGLPTGEFAETSRTVREKLAPLTRRGIAVSVLRA
jgi:hypothetical protein